MELSPFLLDSWLAQKFSADPPVEFDLGASTGPVWTLRELLALAGPDALEHLLDTHLFYTSPTGSKDLREALAGMYGVEPEYIQVCTGSAEALWLLFFHAAEAGANVVLPNPGFPANTAFADAFGLETRLYTLRRQEGFRIDLDEIRGLVDNRTAFVLVNTPHNPTGSILSDAEMEELHEFCAHRGVQLVSDEVYHPIYHGTPARSAARLPHATVLGDFSKALCLSGLRVGWMVERDARRRRRYLNARSYFTASNTSLGERLAVLAVRQRDAIYGRATRVAQANLKLLDDFFAEFSGLLRWVRPQGGMIALPWMADGSNGREFCKRMMQSGVMLAPGDCFGMPDHFRLGFAASGEKFSEGLARLTGALRKGLVQAG